MNPKHINALIKMADKFDREGKSELAEAVDNVLSTRAARPKAPLKKLNDDVKKSLMVFLVDAEDAMGKGHTGLNELFRRMRYFDIGDSIKELGLDKVVKDMEKTQECLDNAKRDFYVMTFGKRPSKSDLEELMSSLKGDEANDGKDVSEMALDFFASEEAQAIDSPGVELEQDMNAESFEDDDDDKEVVEEKETIEEEETDGGKKTTIEKKTVVDSDDDEDEVSDEELANFMDYDEEELDYTPEQIEDLSENILMNLAQSIGVDVEVLQNAIQDAGSLDPDKLVDAILKQKQ